MSLLDDVMGDLKKTYKKKNDTLVFDPNRQKEFISSGSVVLDANLGGGIACRGRLVELFSFESGGKTTLALQSCVEAIKKYPDKTVLFFDQEGHADIEYMNSLGLEIGPNFQIFQPDSAEEVEDITTRFIKKMPDGVSMIVYDSVAAIRPSSMAEHMHGESNQKAGHAFFWTDFSPKINNWAKKFDIAFLLINQLRAKPQIGNMDKFSIGNTGMGAGFSNTDSSFNTTGGTALKFYLSARYLLRHVSDVKEQTEDEITGELIDSKVAKKYKVQNVKNKLTKPHRESNYIIRYGMGTDDAILIRDVLQNAKIITNSGSFINYQSSDGTLDFKENGKIKFMIRFNTEEILQDAIKQYMTLMGGDEIEVNNQYDVNEDGIEEQINL